MIVRRPTLSIPTVKGTNTSNKTSAGTSHTVSLPASIVSGNLLIIVFTATSGPSVTWPGGYSAFFSKIAGALGLYAAYRQADGTEGGTITVTTDASVRSSHASYRIAGHKPPATQVPEASAGAFGSDVNPNPSSLTPTGGSKDYLWIAAQGHRTSETTTGVPASYTNGLSKETASASIGTAERQLNASSEDPGTFTVSGSGNWVACTIAIHPA